MLSGGRGFGIFTATVGGRQTAELQTSDIGRRTEPEAQAA